MLLDLDIRDLAIIDHLSLGLGPGFNVITGETGAGKSIVIDAVGLLLGQRADATVVRAGASRAVISGTFDPAAARGRIEAILATYGVELEPDEVLLLGREVHAAGRSLARVNGRPVPVKALADIGWLLVDIHGQSDAASLMREAEHLARTAMRGCEAGAGSWRPRWRRCARWTESWRAWPRTKPA